MTTIALPRPRNALLDRLHTIQIGVAARGSVGVGLATQRGGAVVTPGWWVVAGKTCMGAYLAKDAASYAASKVNLATPGTYDLINGALYPTWNAAGWALDGTQYLRTGIMVDSGWSMIALISAMSAGYGIAGAMSTTANGFSMRWYPATTRVGIHGSGFAGYVGSPTDHGTMALAGQNLYADGVFLSTGGDATFPAVPELYIGAENTIGVGANYPITGTVQAFAVYSDTLAPGEVADKHAAMMAL